MSIKEESHTLREWQKILANNPELMAEFEEMTPPTPIKGDISEQPVSDHHEIEVEFRGEKVTISREFYRDGEMNYSTSEQDDNAIWSALRAWCEKKGITPFELYPKQSEQPVEYPTSTEMIAEWENNELPMLREKDFRGDAERMAYSAFMDGFAKGLGYKK